MSPRTIVILCGFLMSISAFSTDIMMPSFPAIVADLDAGYAQVQWTIAIYMGMAGLAQIVWGPVSDRVGRRPVLLAGLLIYLAGCALAVAAPSIGMLLTARALQGFGAAAAIVLSRAVLRDLFSGEALGRNFALAMAIFAVGPIVAPLIGGLIAEPLGWRAVFVGLGLFGIGLFLGVWRMPETNAQKRREATDIGILAARLRRVVSHPQSRRFLILSAAIMSTQLLILSTLPRLYDVNFDVRGLDFALLFALHGLGIIVGQTLNRRLIPLFGIVRAMVAANLVLILAAAIALAATWAGVVSAVLMTGVMILYGTSYLVVFSNAATLVLDPHGEIAGFAASIYGVGSQIGGSAIAALLVLAVGDSIAMLSILLVGLCLVTLGMILDWQRKAKPA